MNLQIGEDPRGHGAVYEEKAKEYLMALGYQFIAQNVNFKFGEIDLVFEERKGAQTELVFVEVRKRAVKGMVRPEESITYLKEKRLRCAINRYLQSYRGKASTLRIDLIGFYGDELSHHPNFLQ